MHGSAYVRSCYYSNGRTTRAWVRSQSALITVESVRTVVKGNDSWPVKRAFEEREREEIGNGRHSCKWAQSTLALLFTPNFFFSFPLLAEASRRPRCTATIDYTNTNDTWQVCTRQRVTLLYQPNVTLFLFQPNYRKFNPRVPRYTRMVFCH